MPDTLVPPMPETYARVIADSIYPQGPRLITIEGRFHRYVLAEANTHRVFSRNSASSRAIPYPKQRARVIDTPAMPTVWASEQPGMSGGAEIEDVRAAEDIWLDARLAAAEKADALVELGVHKSIVNRLLEPFMMHTVVITSTAWKNFFNLRCDPNAQPEIRVFAEKVSAAIEASTPTELPMDFWHLPYITREDITAVEEFLFPLRQDSKKNVTDLLIKISTARCAGTSYLTQNQRREVEKDIALYDRLTTNGHASPLEHVARPCPGNTHDVNIGTANEPFYVELPRYGNLLGWRQHRFDVEAANNYEAYA